MDLDQVLASQSNRVLDWYCTTGQGARPGTTKNTTNLGVEMTEQPVEHGGTDHVHTVECSFAPDLARGAAFALYHARTFGEDAEPTMERWDHFWHGMTDEEREPHVTDARIAVAGVGAVMLSAERKGRMN